MQTETVTIFTEENIKKEMQKIGPQTLKFTVCQILKPFIKKDQ